MRILIPTPLRSYTAGRGEVGGTGSTVDEVLRDLDRRCPGLRFRIVDEQDAVRTHIRIFVNGEMADLSTALHDEDEVAIVAALSGG